MMRVIVNTVLNFVLGLLVFAATILVPFVIGHYLDQLVVHLSGARSVTHAQQWTIGFVSMMAIGLFIGLGKFVRDVW